MAVVLSSLLDAYDNVDRTSYTTGSWTPVANQPVYVEVVNYGSTTVPTITDSLSQYTWTQRRTVANGSRVTTLFSAPHVASPSACTITADFAAVTQTGCHVSVVTGSGIDDATTDGIVQSASSTGSGTSGSVTLSAFGSGTNATLMFASDVGANTAITPGGSLANLTDSGGATPTQRTATMWQNTSNTAPSASWGTLGSYLLMAMEIKELVTSFQPFTPWPQMAPILAQ